VLKESLTARFWGRGTTRLGALLPDFVGTLLHDNTKSASGKAHTFLKGRNSSLAQYCTHRLRPASYRKQVTGVTVSPCIYKARKTRPMRKGSTMRQTRSPWLVLRWRIHQPYLNGECCFAVDEAATLAFVRIENAVWYGSCQFVVQGLRPSTFTP
jgi:hypothetical protein